MSAALVPNINIQIPEAFQELFNPWRYKIFYGGRGSAKSHSFARALVARAMESPITILCCRELQKSIKNSVFRLLVNTIKSLGFEDKFDIGINYLKAKNGSEFDCILVKRSCR